MTTAFAPGGLAPHEPRPRSMRRALAGVAALLGGLTAALRPRPM
jgi:hypothetical protein